MRGASVTPPEELPHGYDPAGLNQAMNMPLTQQAPQGVSDNTQAIVEHEPLGNGKCSRQRHDSRYSGPPIILQSGQLSESLYSVPPNPLPQPVVRSLTAASGNGAYSTMTEFPFSVDTRSLDSRICVSTPLSAPTRYVHSNGSISSPPQEMPASAEVQGWVAATEERPHKNSVRWKIRNPTAEAGRVEFTIVLMFRLVDSATEMSTRPCIPLYKCLANHEWLQSTDKLHLTSIFPDSIIDEI
ncbi:hypothetical protein QFC19_001460 [Naganishia cerealis]|uniref:Uncharacterized protein n=1 Tax=Naganishia cerealis TaxID=610337 RepID=A0ACC2WGU0_9TREE|nr:hypothetical protein QFC19_001460 [Naganishia cerealis]